MAKNKEIIKQQIKELEKKYEEMQKFMQSDEYKEYVEYFKKEGNKLDKEILKLLKSRKKTEATKSELDKTYQFYNLMLTFIEKLNNEVFKEVFVEETENILTHIFNKIEEGFDLPLYTELDLIRQKRIDLICIDQRFLRFSTKILEKIDNLKKDLKSDK